MVNRALAVIVAIGMLAGPAAAASVQEGQQLSIHHCAKCHGKDGKGNGPAIQLLGITTPIANWTDKAQMSKMSDAYLTEIITKGGKAVGKSNHMPAFGSKLSGDQIQSMVQYIRSLSK
jgi:mono/diheme cytochrome c family protein